MYASYLDLDLDLNNKECVWGGRRSNWKSGGKEGGKKNR